MQDTNSILAGLSTLAAMLAGISVAVERVVAVIKGAVPPLTKTWPKYDEFRAALLKLIAAVAGAVLASQMPQTVRNSLPFGLGGELNWVACAVIGLVASGGSGAWTQVLDILSALKQKQQAVAAQLATAPTQVTLAPKAAAATP